MHYVLFKNTNNTLTMRGRIAKFLNTFPMVFVNDALIVSLIGCNFLRYAIIDTE